MKNLHPIWPILGGLIIATILLWPAEAWPLLAAPLLSGLVGDA